MANNRPVMQYVWPALALGVAAGLFYSSGLPGEVSGGASMGIISYARESIPILQPLSEDTLHFLLRKGAHFSAYFILAFCTAHGLKYYLSGPGLSFTAWGLASLYGVTDEIHQHFVPGRYCMAGDMLINAAGAAAGAALVWLYLNRRRTHRMEGDDSSMKPT